MRKKITNKTRIILLSSALLCVAAASFSIAVYKYLAPDIDAPCQKTIERLQRLEAEDISITEKRLQVLQKNAVSSTDNKVLGNQADVQSSIENGNILDNVSIRQKFQNTVIIGDSITESISGYGYLDTDVVVAQLGLSIKAADDHIATAISLAPSTIFMSFGANDLEIYVGDVESFIAAYKTQIEKIKSALPDTTIYINSILPILPSAIEQIPALGYYLDFNKGLESLCTETGCTYLDASFLLENHEEMYEPDGEHVVMSFYPSWLTYMAEMAGL